MTVLGIDPSIRATGLAWKPPRRQWRTYLERGDDRWRLRKIIALAASEGCSCAFIEEVFAGPNRKTSLRLAGLGGEIRAWCINNGMDFVMVPAKTWQSAMLGDFEKGKHKAASIRSAESLGADVYRNVYTPTKKNVKDDNMADAVNLAEYGRLQEEITHE